MIHVWIPGEPKGQPRPRGRSVKRCPAGHIFGVKRRACSKCGLPGIPTTRVYDPEKHVKPWKAAIRRAMEPILRFSQPTHWDCLPLPGPLRVDMLFKMPRPRAMVRKRPHPEDGEIPHVKTPDLTNLAKLVEDVLTGLGVWLDDSQVCDGWIRKVYHRDKGGEPGLELTIRPYEGGQDEQVDRSQTDHD